MNQLNKKKNNIKKLMIRILVVSAVLITTFPIKLTGQELIAKYEQSTFLSAFQLPLTIGLFKFEGDERFEEEFLQRIENEVFVADIYVIYPSETLESLKEDFEIKSFNSNDLDCLHKLKDKLDIQLILVGKEAPNKDLQIDFVDTETGEIIFSNVYKLSKNSTMLNDLIKLFTDQKTTIYKREIKNLPEMVLVEKGEIVVRPLRYDPETIIVKNNYLISKYECTIRQFSEFIQMTGYITDAENNGYSIIYYSDNSKSKDSTVTWKCDEIGVIRPGFDSLDYPVIHISWNDAIEYCNWLSKETGDQYTLPTSNEWQFASLGGIHSKNFTYSGSNDIEEVGWCKNNSNEKVHLIGTKGSNEIGLADMSGNVREWCYDWFQIKAQNGHNSQKVLLEFI